MLSRWFRRGANLDLWDEAAEGLLGLVKERIEAGANVNARRKPPVEPLDQVLIGRVVPVSWTPLMYASWYGQLAVVQHLLASGANPNLEDFENNTALDVAAIQGHDAIVTALLEAGADPRHRDKEGRAARDYAMMAGHDTIVRQLLRVHPADSLPEALAYDDIVAATRLLASGADPNVADFMSRTLLDLAEAVGNIEFAQLLRDHGAIRGAGFTDKDAGVK
jgi:ankyrin repeat protein